MSVLPKQMQYRPQNYCVDCNHYVQIHQTQRNYRKYYCFIFSLNIVLFCLFDSGSHLALCDSSICSGVHQTFRNYISNNVCFFFYVPRSGIQIVIVWYMRHCMIFMHCKLQHRHCQLKIRMKFWSKQHFWLASAINSNRIWIIIDTEEWIRFWWE